MEIQFSGHDIYSSFRFIIFVCMYSGKWSMFRDPASPSKESNDSLPN